jgi:hypothetical protein
LSLEIRDGELQCPFCKRVANLLVPLVPPAVLESAPGKKEEALSEDGEDVAPSASAVSAGEGEEEEVWQEVRWLQDLLGSLSLGDEGPGDGDDGDEGDEGGEGVVGGASPLAAMVDAFARHLSEMGKPERRGLVADEAWRSSSANATAAFARATAAFAYSACALVAEGDEEDAPAAQAGSAEGEGETVVSVGAAAMARRRRHLQAVSTSPLPHVRFVERRLKRPARVPATCCRQVGGAVRAASEPLRGVLRLALSGTFAGTGREKGTFETAALLGRNALETMVAALCLASAAGPRAVLGAVSPGPPLIRSPCHFLAAFYPGGLFNPTARKECPQVCIRFP